MQLKLGEKTYELATTLRVVYALRDIAHANSLQGAINSISKLDLDGQLELLYAAYSAANSKRSDCLSKEVFIDEMLDRLGIFAITGAINKLADGLLYSGLSPEEIASKKAAVEATVATKTATGARSSAEVIN